VLMSQSLPVTTRDPITEGSCTHRQGPYPLRRNHPPPPRPHSAVELKEVTNYNKEILQDFLENHLEGPHAFPKWDKAKRLMCTHAIEAWKRKVRARGRNLKFLTKRCTKLSIDLHCMPVNHRHCTVTKDNLVQYTRSLHIATAKDMAMCKEAIEAKWIQMSGKPNKDFLAKPKGTRKRIGNMTIDNVKDKPDLPRTDDINVILYNFVEYYSKLYEYKSICLIALDRLIGNLTINFDAEEAEALNKPLTTK
jgi:hypothetical protein